MNGNGVLRNVKKIRSEIRNGNGNGAILAMTIYGDDLFWRINSAVNGGFFHIKKIKN